MKGKRQLINNEWIAIFGIQLRGDQKFINIKCI